MLFVNSLVHKIEIIHFVSLFVHRTYPHLLFSHSTKKEQEINLKKRKKAKYKCSLYQFNSKHLVYSHFRFTSYSNCANSLPIHSFRLPRNWQKPYHKLVWPFIVVTFLFIFFLLLCAFLFCGPLYMHFVEANTWRAAQPKITQGQTQSKMGVPQFNLPNVLRLNLVAKHNAMIGFFS